MRAGTLLNLFFLTVLSWPAQSQVNDDFSDGDFTHDPRWEGDSLHFEVNAGNQLHLRWAGSDTSVLAIENTMSDETEWNFWVKLSFNTSVNNYLRVYLMADRSELDQPLNGFFLQAGGEEDSLIVYRQEGFDLIPLLHFPDGYTELSVNTLRVRIIRDPEGVWQAGIDPEGGTNYLHQGAWIDPANQQAAWFGFLCRYTSSNASRFYMDDIYIGPVKWDTVPPRLVSLSVPDSLRILLTFSESPDDETAKEITNYKLFRTQAHPVEAMIPAGNSDQVRLTFMEPFQMGKTDSLLITDITDPEGNRMEDTLVPFSFTRSGIFDVLIHEIMYDPDPSVGLPPEEYVELYNTTSCPLNLDGWRIDAGTVRKVLPPVMIRDHGYLVLTRDSAQASYEPSVGLFTSVSSLPNEGGMIVLRDADLNVIHEVKYSPDWITESWKEEGGWSLEMVDPGNPCGCDENWKASADASGGTPGRINSVSGYNPDLVAPEIWRSYFADSVTWEVLFTEKLDTSAIGTSSAWSVEPGGRLPVAMVPVPLQHSKVRLIFSEPFEPEIIYTLSGSDDITDCAGNHLEQPAVTRAGIPDATGSGGIIINEVLHDPLPGGSRFIELFNRSGNLIDLHDLALEVSDTGSGDGVPAITILTSEPFLVFPLDFVVLCNTGRGISKYYNIPYPERFLEMDPFPSMQNESGSISLIRAGNCTLIDRMTYSRAMHFPLLTTVQGVSLERISPDQPSGMRSNWHSASATAGYATPGFENSQWLRADAGEGGMTIHPVVFSPDNDGHEDVTSIGINTDEAGYQVTILIYDASGRIVRKMASNALAGCDDVFTWDGSRDDHTVATAGIYVVYLEMTHPSGIVKRFRKTLVVAAVL